MASSRTIRITVTAARDIQKLDGASRARIGMKLAGFAKDPLRHARKLTDPKIGNYRFRIGNFRVIFDLTEDELVVLRVGPRKDIYR